MPLFETPLFFRLFFNFLTGFGTASQPVICDGYVFKNTMSKSEDIIDYSDSHIPETVGYINGMLDSFGLFTNKEDYRQYCIIELLELPIEDKNKVVQQRADGNATDLVQTDDYVAGELEKKLNIFFKKQLESNELLTQVDEISINTWKYLIWRIAEFFSFLELKDFVKSCIVEKSIVKNPNDEEEGIIYCLTIDSKYFVVLKIHDVKAPKEDIEDYNEALEEYKSVLNKSQNT